MDTFEVLTDDELALVVGGARPPHTSVNPSHVMYKLTGIGQCGCGAAHG